MALKQDKLARWVAFGVLVGVFGLLPASANDRLPEVNLPPEMFARLDRFESHLLSKADAAYGKGEWREAAKTYDAFEAEFPRALTTIPYVLLRKGRSLQQDQKRFEAIKIYRQVLDYFPNDVYYAAAALYYIGMCHWQSADGQEAMKAWAEMAEDTEYRLHFLAADALNRLAEYLETKGQLEKAMHYFRQVALDFRRNNPGAAFAAMGKVVGFHVRTRPGEPAYQKFYRDVSGLDHQPRSVPEDLTNDWTYWNTLRGHVVEHGRRWSETQAEARKAYFAYWAGVVGDRFAANDDFRLQVFDWHLAVEGDTAKWIARLDQQFAANQKTGDWNRINRWIALFGENEEKVREYYQKLDFGKMDNNQKRATMVALWDRSKQPTMARAVFQRLDFTRMTDAERASLARWFWLRDGAIVEQICRRFENAEYGAMELLLYYEATNDLAKALPVADGLRASPDYAAAALWVKANMQFKAGRWKDALDTYRECSDNVPDNLFRIAECYAHLGQFEPAVGQLKEIESFFKDHASQAALRVADIYRRAKNAPMEIAALRHVMKAYPKSGQSNQAHLRLEGLDVRIGGGVDERER